MKLKNSLLAGAALLALMPDAAFAQTGSRKLLDPANIDSSVSPRQNFFWYANGAWLKNNPIPPTETRWGSFNELQENIYTALHNLLAEAASKRGAKGSRDQKVGDFYKSGMDSASIERAGLTPLKPIFSRIDAISTPAGLLAEISKQHTQGIGPLFSFYIYPDDKQVSRQIPQFYQGGLGMPDRDYYFNTDARTTKIREAYQQYLLSMFGLMGEDAGNASRLAKAVFELEQKLAGASMTRVELRDPYKSYNKFNLAGISARTPGIDWKAMFNGLKIQGQDSLIVGQPGFFREAAAQMSQTPLDVWKAYLKFHVVNDMAPYLSSRFDEARFDFYGRTLRGQQAQRPRWKRVLQVVDGSVGELLGQMYVERNFKPQAKERMLELVNNLQTTYADRIQRLDWMSDATKGKALAKLNTFMKKIGYPDKWKDYSKLSIGTSYVDNILASAEFEYNYNISKLGRPVDRSEWGMTPPTVNAYYNPAFNEIVFPAGILQYPFFDFDADDAINYGGIGAVIGHEMTHGFDDQGRQYDAHGNLNDWWTPEDAKKFEEKANVVKEQFNSYTVLDSMRVNGELTLGENLADLGGLAIAYEAFKKTKQGRENRMIDGFTADQRFFLSWAQVWRANTRDEEMASRIMTDPHSPNELRTNGPLSNMPEFYKAFGVQPGDAMYRDEASRARVW